ncbi:MAG: hypothetical protein A3A27_02420 [Candidatus Wildermuthbacteria bacterium RIFCSPLOWO2_01_FULL_47_18]|uniref:Uncharacterized protein n=1 Tax=Candidatus Wildermuthbacteria bacterium RIFCSPLOWO2_01_FULL_47_18 TaxID=1802460 RepID=A0A1G2RJK0_9BACT|nr:MAG: hypothetical protein A3A27_02420 [Candidatus Wildermuthbacteria bacterium RIFCSPLOWO2_01_FULL_47_18]
MHEKDAHSAATGRASKPMPRTAEARARRSEVDRRGKDAQLGSNKSFLELCFCTRKILMESDFPALLDKEFLS